MKPLCRRAARLCLLTVLASLVLMLTGSGDPNRPMPKPRAMESAAAALGSELPKEDRAAWEHASRINPLWLIEAAVR